jgi:hypothetical protein
MKKNLMLFCILKGKKIPASKDTLIVYLSLLMPLFRKINPNLRIALT